MDFMGEARKRKEQKIDNIQTSNTTRSNSYDFMGEARERKYKTFDFNGYMNKVVTFDTNLTNYYNQNKTKYNFDFDRFDIDTMKKETQTAIGFVNYNKANLQNADELLDYLNNVNTYLNSWNTSFGEMKSTRAEFDDETAWNTAVRAETVDKEYQGIDALNDAVLGISAGWNPYDYTSYEASNKNEDGTYKTDELYGSWSRQATSKQDTQRAINVIDKEIEDLNKALQYSVLCEYAIATVNRDAGEKSKIQSLYPEVLNYNIEQWMKLEFGINAEKLLEGELDEEKVLKSEEARRKLGDKIATEQIEKRIATLESTKDAIDKEGTANAYTKGITLKEDFEQHSKYSPVKKTDEELKELGYKQHASGEWYIIDGLGRRETYFGEDTCYAYINDPSIREIVDTQQKIIYEEETYKNNGYDTLTETEIGVYNYLHYQDRKNGTRTAENYLFMLSPLLEKRALQKDAELHAEFAREAPIPANIYSFYTNFKNAQMFPYKVALTALGDYDAGNNYLLDKYGNRTQAIRSATSENMPYIGKIVYNAGMSIGDMGIAMLAGGGDKILTQAIMSSSAGSSAITDAKNNGASDAKALVMGIGSAAIEWATEKYSIEAILKNPKGTLKYFLKNAITEGTEEGASNIANTILDIVASDVLGETNEIEQRIAELVLDGNTEEEAFKIVVEEKLKSLRDDVITGMLAGGGMSQITSAPSYIDSFKQSAKIGTEGTQALIDEGVAIGNELAIKTQQKGGNAGMVRRAEILQENKRIRAEMYQAGQKGQNEVKTTTAEYLRRMGENGDVEALSTAVSNIVTGQATQADISLVAQSKNAQTAVELLTNRKVKTEEKSVKANLTKIAAEKIVAAETKNVSKEIKISGPKVNPEEALVRDEYVEGIAQNDMLDYNVVTEDGNFSPIKLRYSPAGLKLPKNEFAKFNQSVSTDYRLPYKTHKGLQYQSCVFDDKHILYVYEDGGFGNYNPVARIDYANGDIVNTFIGVLENGEHYEITEAVDAILETSEVRQRGYSVYNAYTKKRRRSRGDGSLLARTSEGDTGRTDASSGGFAGNERGNEGRIGQDEQLSDQTLENGIQDISETTERNATPAQVEQYIDDFENSRLRTGAEIDTKLKNNIHTLIRKFKVQILFDTEVPANGKYENGVIRINPNSEKPIRNILFHEFTHHIERTGQSYIKFMDAVVKSTVFKEWVKEKGFSSFEEIANDRLVNYNKKIDKINEEHRKKGEKEEKYLDNFGAKLEVVADFAGDRLFNKNMPKAINAFVSEMREWGQRIRDWLRKHKILKENTTNGALREIQKLEELFSKALEKANGQKNNTTSGAQYDLDINNEEQLEENEREVYNKSTNYSLYTDEVLYSSRYEEIKRSDITKAWYDNAKKGDVESAYELLKKLIQDTVINKIRDLGNDVYLLPVVGADGTSTNVLPRITAGYLNEKTGQSVFYGIYKKHSSDSRNTTIWERMKENYPSFEIGKKSNIKPSDIASKKFILIDDNSTTGRTFVGFKNFIEGNGGEVVGYYALTTGHDQSEKMITTDETWSELVTLGLDEVKNFAKKEGIKREISKLGLTERETQQLIKQFKNERIDSGRGVENDTRSGRGSGEIYAVYETERSNGKAEERNEINSSFEETDVERGNSQYSFTIPTPSKADADTTPQLERRQGRSGKGDSISSFADNIERSSWLDEDLKERILSDEGIVSYNRIANADTLSEAFDKLENGGASETSRLTNLAYNKNAQVNETDVAELFILLEQYQAKGDYESAHRVVQELSEIGRRAGRTVQMFSILGRMTPEGMTMYAQRELDEAFEKYTKHKSKEFTDKVKGQFELTEDEIEFIRLKVEQAAWLPEGRDKQIVLAQISSLIQDKIPSTVGDKLNSLQRIALLLNPKTNIRNVLGNAIVTPLHIASDFIATPIDTMISKATGVRTTSGFDVSSVGKGVKKGVFETFDDFRRHIDTKGYEDRYEISKSGEAWKGKNALSKAVRTLDRVTSFFLELGDRPFFEMWFINSLNTQMKANKASEPTAEMIEIATEEALQRTWQDSSKFAQGAVKIRNGLNFGKKFGVGSMLVKFVKTPANLLKAVYDFSPVGLTVAMTYEANKFKNAVQKGEATAKMQRDFVKSLGQGIGGTLLMILFGALAKKGLITGAGDEDKEVAAFERYVLGKQPYSIRIGNKSFSYEWAQPISTLMAISADIVNGTGGEYFKGKHSDFVNTILSAISAGGNIIFDQSFLKGLKTFMEEEDTVNAILSLVYNEPSAFTSTLLGQFASLGDDTQRRTYSKTWYENILNPVKNKIPGLRETLEPNVNVMGEEVKNKNDVFNVFFNPANSIQGTSSDAAEEIYRLYLETGEKGIFPAKAPYYVTVSGKKYDMTEKERTQYQKLTGSIISDEVERMLDNPYYEKLSDEQKVELVSEMVSYSRAYAKAEITDTEISKTYTKAKLADDKGVGAYWWYLYDFLADTNGNGYLTKAEKRAAARKLNITPAQKAYLKALEELSAKKK